MQIIQVNTTVINTCMMAVFLSESASIVRPRPAGARIEGTPGMLPRSSLDMYDEQEKQLATIIEIPTDEGELKDEKDKTKSGAATTSTPVIKPSPVVPKKVVGGKWL